MDPSASQPLWSHAPHPGRDERTAYRLPQNEVLPWLMGQTDFLADSSTPANEMARQVIHQDQYPKLHGDTAPLADRPPWTGAETARRLERFVADYARQHLDERFVKVGYTPVLPEHVYASCDQPLPRAAVLGLPMRYEQTNLAPAPAAGEEVTRNYMELGGLTLAVGQWLREQGFAAEVHHPRGDDRMTCELLFIPHAIAAGFGELGRHGSLISREFGPRVRLSMVTTDAPLEATGEQAVGAAEFCSWCTKCLAACPVDAIPEDRTTLRGSYRYVVDTTACLPYFAETDGCGICIAVCPYNRRSEEAAGEFTDDVLGLDWVRRARHIAAAEGVAAMERAVRERRERGREPRGDVPK